jgi:hypothetical protein
MQAREPTLCAESGRNITGNANNIFIASVLPYTEEWSEGCFLPERRGS